jgi:cytochrome P450
MDPPPGFAALRAQAPLVRVRHWDGSTPWLVTRYDEQQALLVDRRVSADITGPDTRTAPRPCANARAGSTPS